MATIDLSLIVAALGDMRDLPRLLRQLNDVATALGVSHEVLVVSERDDRATACEVARWGGVLARPRGPGYGDALAEGFRRARGTFWVTLDADLSHPTEFVHALWHHRQDADIVVASRYAAGGTAHMSYARRVLSRMLNRAFSRGLSLDVADMSSGFRLYRSEIFRDREFEGSEFNILQEILVRAYADGWSVREVPFHYESVQTRGSAGRVVRFGVDYARTFWRLWTLRNSILCADYDARAYDSPIPLQRYWQRQRFAHVVEFISGEDRVLDVGCGSSRIIGALPPGSVAMDILQRKLRYAKRFGRHLVRASGFQIPFGDATFPCVLCSQVIEHVPKDSGILEELCRVLASGGRLVLGTPDYDRWEWIVTERLYGLAAPGGYADEHIAHYTKDELIALFAARGFALEGVRYILHGELILAFRKN